MKKKFLFIAPLCMMLFFTALPVKASENTDAISKTNTAVVESQDKQASLAAPELTATNLSGSIKVSWNKVSSADGYYIYRRTADGNWSDSPYKTISSNSTTSFEDESYKAGTDYYYRAVSYKKSNGKTVKSNYSAEVFLRRLSRPTLSKSRGDLVNHLTWKTISGATGYVVYRGDKKLDETTNPFYSDTSVKHGTKYEYTVKAYYQNDSQKCYSASSKEISITGRNVDLTAPVCEIENLSSSIRVSWSTVPRAGGYFIYRRAAGEDWSPTPHARVDGNPSHEYIDEDFKKGTTYYYKVSAYRSYSGERIAGSLSKQKLIVRLSRPSVTVANSDSAIELSWKEISGAERYAIYRNDERIGSTKKLTYKDDEIKNGTKYQYEVRAYTTVDDEDYFSEYSSTDTIYRLKKPVLKDLDEGYKKFTAKYEKNSKASGYQIHYAKKSDFSDAKKVSTTSTSKTISSLSADTEYYVKVRSYKKVGTKYYYSAYSNVMTIVTD